MNFEWVVSFYRITKKKRKELWKNYSSFLRTSQRSWTLYRCTCYRWPAGHRYLKLRLTHLSQLGLKLEDWDRLIQKHLLFCFGVFFFSRGKSLGKQETAISRGQEYALGSTCVICCFGTQLKIVSIILIVLQSDARRVKQVLINQPLIWYEWNIYSSQPR